MLIDVGGLWLWVNTGKSMIVVMVDWSMVVDVGGYYTGGSFTIGYIGVMANSYLEMIDVGCC